VAPAGYNFTADIKPFVKPSSISLGFDTSESDASSNSNSNMYFV